MKLDRNNNEEEPNPNLHIFIVFKNNFRGKTIILKIYGVNGPAPLPFPMRPR